MWKYTYNLRGLYETPDPAEADGDEPPDRSAAAGVIETVRASGRTLLTEYEAKRVLALYKIPVVETHVASTEDGAVEWASVLGFPVVLKLFSETITHKTDVGGVKLNLVDKAAVHRAYQEIRQAVTEKAGKEHFHGVTVQPMVKLADAYELIVGSSVDSQFGPVGLIGAGGVHVEAMADVRHALPPFDSSSAHRRGQRLRVHALLTSPRPATPLALDAF